MITVESVTEKNWEKLVTLFETSEECTDCWCMNHRSDPNSCPTGTQAKAAMQEEIRSGRAYGLLAIKNNIAIGWCAIDPVLTQIGHDYCLQKKEKLSPTSWMIHCLYIDSSHRGAGVSKKLITSAIEKAKSEGATEVLAFPIPEDSTGKFPKDIAEFSGRLSTYQKLGFELRERLDNFYQVVAKVI
jgi:GNAT superfamily N-acetyltransferase